MIKTHVVSSSNMLALQNSINEFVKDKKVIDIKFQSVVSPSHYQNGCYDRFDVIDRVLIIYEVEQDGIVEVVRCKDCKHCKKDSHWKELYCLKMSDDEHTHWLDKDFYCGYGERRSE